MSTRRHATSADVLSAVKREVARAGGYRALAREWGVNASYISDVVRGRRDPGPAITKHLGLRAERVYVRTDGEAA